MSQILIDDHSMTANEYQRKQQALADGHVDALRGAGYDFRQDVDGEYQVLIPAQWQAFGKTNDEKLQRVLWKMKRTNLLLLRRGIESYCAGKRMLETAPIPAEMPATQREILLSPPSTQEYQGNSIVNSAKQILQAIVRFLVKVY